MKMSERPLYHQQHYNYPLSSSISKTVLNDTNVYMVYMMVIVSWLLCSKCFFSFRITNLDDETCYELIFVTHIYICDDDGHFIEVFFSHLIVPIPPNITRNHHFFWRYSISVFLLKLQSYVAMDIGWTLLQLNLKFVCNTKCFFFFHLLDFVIYIVNIHMGNMVNKQVRRCCQRHFYRSSFDNI